MIGSYLISDLVMRITSLCGEVHSLCYSYSVQDCPETIVVETTQDDIEFERIKCAVDDERAGIPIRPFSDGYLETLAVYRKIAERLPEFDALLVHGSCVAVDGEGYLFMASSGVGKSTHARLWRELLGDRAIMVNDDKPIIRFQDGRPIIYGTPWDGKHRLSTNIGVPLKAICILSRGDVDAIQSVSPALAFPKLLKHVYRPTDPSALQKTLQLVDALADSVSLWQLQCTMNVTAAEVAYEAMRG